MKKSVTFSNFPPELYSNLFFDYLDENSRLECITLNKKIHNFIYSEVLSDLKIIPKENSTLNSNLMGYYKIRCDYFRNKLPKDTFVFEKDSTIIEVKKIIDNRLSIKMKNFNISLVQEIWRNFMCQIAPKTHKKGRLIIMSPGVDNKIQPSSEINNFFLPNPNDEIQILLNAGVRPNYDYNHTSMFFDLTSIIKQDWCTLETIQLLVDKNFLIMAETILTAIKFGKKYDSILPIFFKFLEDNQSFLESLLKDLPETHYFLLDHYINRDYCIHRMTKVYAYHIKIAIERNYSEKTILKLLSKCTSRNGRKYIKGSKENNVTLALERKCTEDLIIELIHKCKKGEHGRSAFNVKLAAKSKYSEGLILVLLSKCEYEIDYFSINIALKNGYSEDLITSLMYKIKKSDQLKGLEELIQSGSSEVLIEKFLSEAKGIYIHLTLSQSLKYKYSEKIISKIVEQVEYVMLKDIKAAKQMGYSTNLIKNMQEKCIEN